MSDCDCSKMRCHVQAAGGSVEYTCLSCGAVYRHDEDADADAQRAADRLAVSRVILGLGFVSMSLSGLAAWHRELSGLFALAMVGMLMAILSVCIRRRWIA